jgi:hypothetical protein
VKKVGVHMELVIGMVHWNNEQSSVVRDLRDREKRRRQRHKF